jgi:hypothetical protein
MFAWLGYNNLAVLVFNLVPALSQTVPSRVKHRRIGEGVDQHLVLERGAQRGAARCARSR